MPDEELHPWLARLNERMAQQGVLAEPPSEEGARRIMEAAVLPVVREMANSIFTPGRIQKLIADLKKYQSDLFATGHKAVAGQIMGPISYLKREDSPGKNSFLIALCWRSVCSVIDSEEDETD